MEHYVEKKKYSLFLEVMRRMEKEGILDGIILAGSWCMVLYEEYFNGKGIFPPLRTRDIDLLFPLPLKLRQKIDLFGLLKDLGFILDYKGEQGYITFQHPDLILEFLVPARGKENNKPFSLDLLGINAQPLRFMDMLCRNPIIVLFEGIKVTIPHPIDFALHKIIISARRNKPVKKENDIRQAIEVLRAIIKAKEEDHIKQVFLSCPGTWQKNIIKILKDEPLTEDILSVLQ